MVVGGGRRLAGAWKLVVLGWRWVVGEAAGRPLLSCVAVAGRGMEVGRVRVVEAAGMSIAEVVDGDDW